MRLGATFPSRDRGPYSPVTTLPIIDAIIYAENASSQFLPADSAFASRILHLLPLLKYQYLYNVNASFMNTSSEHHHTHQ